MPASTSPIHTRQPFAACGPPAGTGVPGVAGGEDHDQSMEERLLLG